MLKVLAAKKITVMLKTTHTDKVILTFQTTTLPNDIKVGYFSVPVDAYTPVPSDASNASRLVITILPVRGEPSVPNVARVGTKNRTVPMSPTASTALETTQHLPGIAPNG